MRAQEIIVGLVVFMCASGSEIARTSSCCSLVGRDTVRAVAHSSILLPVGKRGTKDDLFRLTPTGGGVLFDLDGDGMKELTAWTAENANIGFLALDRNGNGAIDDGTELFGASTYRDVDNGFAALSRMARSFRPRSDPIAMVDMDSPLYSRLVIWVDRDHNGISARVELEPLATYYTEIGLGYRDEDTKDEFGNAFRFKGWAVVRTAFERYAVRERDDLSQVIDIYEVLFAVLK